LRQKILNGVKLYLAGVFENEMTTVVIINDKIENAQLIESNEEAIPD